MSVPGHPRHQLDPVIHAPVRLSVMAALVGVDKAQFRTVRDAVEVSDSALSKAVARLEEAGYVAVAKNRDGRQPTTWLSLSPAGEAALTAHLSALSAITSSASHSASSVRPAPTAPAPAELEAATTS